MKRILVFILALFLVFSFTVAISCNSSNVPGTLEVKPLD